MKKQISVLISMTILAIILCSAVNAANYYVNDTNGLDSNPGTIDQPFKTIWKGENVTTDGDTVIIAPGTYMGSLNKNIYIDHNITIQGAGANQTIIDCEDSGSAFSYHRANGTIIKDLTIQNANALSSGGAIYSWGNSTIINCNFINNTAGGRGGAIYNVQYSNLVIIGCTFDGNAANEGGAIANWVSSNITAIGCNFNNNTGLTNGGAIYSNNGNLDIKYSRFVGNTVENTLNDIYLGSSYADLRFNWWGSNLGPGERISGGEFDYNPYLMLTIKADPLTIKAGQTSKLTANVYMDSDGVDHSADAAQFFSGPELTFTTNLGNVGSKSVTVPWTLGMAYAILRGDEGPGIATLTAADIQAVSTIVNILQDPTDDPQDPTVNAASETSNTVGMQETGMPLAGLILAVLMLFTGLITSKR